MIIPRGLFGAGLAGLGAGKERQGLLNSVAAMSSPDMFRKNPPAMRGLPERPELGFRDRAYDFFAELGGEGSPRRAQAEAEIFGRQFGSLLEDPGLDPASRDMQMGRLRSLIAARAARGEDTAALERLAAGFGADGMARDAAQALPPELQPFARISPESGAQYQFGRHMPETFAVGGDLVTGSAAGGYRRSFEGPERLPDGFMRDPQNPAGLIPIPGGPADPGYEYNRNFQARRGQVEATPPDSIEPQMPDTNDIVGQVLQRVMQVGVEGLSSGERAIWDRYNREQQNPLAALFGGDLGGGGGAAAQERVYEPRDEQDLLRNVPIGGRYRNPADGQIYTRQR